MGLGGEGGGDTKSETTHKGTNMGEQQNRVEGKLALARARGEKEPEGSGFIFSSFIPPSPGVSFFPRKERKKERRRRETVGVKWGRKNKPTSFKHSERRATGDGTRVDVAARLLDDPAVRSPDGVDAWMLNRQVV